MQFLHVTNSEKDIEKVNKYINDGKHVFLFIHSESCGHCIHSFPFWKQLKNRLAHKKRPDVLVADINAKALSDENKIAKVGPINGYPTIKYIHGKKVEEFNQERTTDLFMNWIETDIGNGVSIANKTRKGQHGGLGFWTNNKQIVPITTDEKTQMKVTWNEYVSHNFYSMYRYLKNPYSDNDIFCVENVEKDKNNYYIIGYYFKNKDKDNNKVTIKINITEHGNQEIYVSEESNFITGGSRKRSILKRSILKRSNRKRIRKRTIRKN